MASPPADLDASLGTSLDFEFGNRRASGVVFNRHSAAHVDETINGENGGGGNNVGASAPTQTTSLNDTITDPNEKITLPQSTHSLLFTEKVLSLPFLFAITIAFISFACLALSLWDNLSGGYTGNPLNVPANVSYQVRAAQYLSILISIMMEEEIPTGTYLLRMIPKSSVQSKLVGVKYWKFVLSAIMRLFIGYLFLINVWLAVVQSDRVLDMFYDMLALSFVSQTDDIAFQLAKYDVMGKTLRNATSTKAFGVGFAKRPYNYRKKMTIFVKFLYIFNVILFLGGISVIAVLQRTGYFQCESVMITFGDEIWEHAWVDTTHDGHNGETRQMVLVYSYFNGIYKQEGTHKGRPVYKEMRKTDKGTPYETKVGAEIKYCSDESAWIFTHPHIRRSASEEPSECPWLLRSPDTDAYDLLDVPREDWSIWIGTIDKNAQMSVTCNECKDDTECNLNGKCQQGECVCNPNSGHEGVHCEHEKPCQHIIGAQYNDTWSLLHDIDCQVLYSYDRPVYTLTHVDDAFKMISVNGVITLQEADLLNLVFAGSRWFGLRLVGGGNLTVNELQELGKEFHSFWDEAYTTSSIVVSDITTSSFPVGVDFYRIGERGPQYGPFGVLYPLQEPPGRGNFRCYEDDDSLPFEPSTLVSLLSTSCGQQNYSISNLPNGPRQPVNQPPNMP